MVHVGRTPQRPSTASMGRARHHSNSTAGHPGMALQTCRRRAKGLGELSQQSQPVHDKHRAALHRPKDKAVLQTPALVGLCCWYHPSWMARARQQCRKALGAAPWPQAIQDSGKGWLGSAGWAQEGWAGGTGPTMPAAFWPSPERVTHCHKKSFVWFLICGGHLRLAFTTQQWNNTRGESSVQCPADTPSSQCLAPPPTLHDTIQ